jgi:hypothetical protein
VLCGGSKTLMMGEISLNWHSMLKISKTPDRRSLVCKSGAYIIGEIQKNVCEVGINKIDKKTASEW